MAGLLTPDPVAVTLKQWGNTCFVWGHSDCAMSLFHYLARSGRSGALHRWQRRYIDEQEADAIVRAAGGPLSAFSAEMAKEGLERTRTPQRGDVGVARAPGGDMVACLCLGEGWWAARRRTGFAAWRPRFPMAWEVNRLA